MQFTQRPGGRERFEAVDAARHVSPFCISLVSRCLFVKSICPHFSVGRSPTPFIPKGSARGRTFGGGDGSNAEKQFTQRPEEGRVQPMCIRPCTCSVSPCLFVKRIFRSFLRGTHRHLKQNLKCTPCQCIMFPVKTHRTISENPLVIFSWRSLIPLRYGKRLRDCRSTPKIFENILSPFSSRKTGHFSYGKSRGAHLSADTHRR
jgi:hypothetical protein